MAPTIRVIGPLSPEEFEEGYRTANDALLRYIAESGSRRPKMVTAELDGEEWKIIIELPEPNIARVRRITGYLSNLNNFNGGKKAEEKDRVVHAKGGA
jgi:hypothetical protein